MFNKFLKNLNLPDSFVSVTLGFLVVIVVGLLIYNYFSKGKQTAEQTSKNEVIYEEKSVDKATLLPTTHKVSDNENLWTIAVKYYDSGYNWVTIAQANKLANPNLLAVGQELTIPKAEVIKATGEVSSTATEPAKTYTVVKGDNLWNIAVKEYGDGFTWTKIAQANKLVNPNLIHAGNVLTLPR